MKSRWLSTGCLIVSATCLVLGTNGMADTQILKELRETVSKLRGMSGPSMTRTNTGEHLSQLTEKIDPKEVDDKTLENLVSLLDAPDDSVRFWVAASLGHLGPRAKGAVPALLKVMRETDCLELKEMISAGAARVALKRIGVTLPSRDCGKK